MKKVALFCASANHIAPCYITAADEVGTHIGQNGWHLIYGGANIGLMERVATAARDAGGTVEGIITHKICALGKESLIPQTMQRVDTLFQRKEKMIEAADLFVVLPGGIGTLDELFDVLSTAQLGYHNKQTLICNFNNFYTPLLQLIDGLITSGFASENYKSHYTVVTDINAFKNEINKYAQHC